MTIQTVDDTSPTDRATLQHPVRALIITGLVDGGAVVGVMAIIGAPVLLMHRQDVPLEQQYRPFCGGTGGTSHGR